MNKKGFTLIEVIVSVVLVSVVMVSLLSSLIQLRKTYTVIHEDSDIIVYSSSISRIINNDLIDNNGIRYVSCNLDRTKCDMILGNDDKRILEIGKEEIDDLTYEDGTKQVVRTTLRYIDSTKEKKELLYIRTLDLDRYERDGKVTTSGYNFLDINPEQTEQNVPGGALIDTYTTVTIRIYNGVDEQVSKYNIKLYTAGRYDYSHLVGKVFTIGLNSNGADVVGARQIDEVFGVGFFETESNHNVNNQLRQIEIPKKGTLAFLGYFYKKNGVETVVVDSTGKITVTNRFFKENVEVPYDSENPEEETQVYAKWGACQSGYEIKNGGCYPKNCTVKYNLNGGTMYTTNYTGNNLITVNDGPAYEVLYNQLVPDLNGYSANPVEVPVRGGYEFGGFKYGSVLYHNAEGFGQLRNQYYNDGGGCPMSITAQWTPCPAGQFSLIKDITCSICTAKSYTPAQGTTKCLACGEESSTAGFTNSGTGNTGCTTPCSNNYQANTWKQAHWHDGTDGYTKNTVTDVCVINSCNTGYAVQNPNSDNTYCKIVNPATPTIKTATEKIYGSSDTTLTCTTTTTYVTGTNIYYSFGYATSAGGTLGNWTEYSTTNTLKVGKTSYAEGEFDRYYACRVYAHDDSGHSKAEELGKTSVITSDRSGDILIRYNNAKITFDAISNGGTLSGNAAVYVRTGAKTIYSGIRTSGTTNAPVALQPGYQFNGWYTAKTGGTKVINPDRSVPNNFTFTSDVILYAQFSKCEEGTYNPTTNTATTCTACADAYYQDQKGQTSCNACPNSYNHSDSGRKASTNCYIDVAGGYYKTSATGTSTSGCGDGTYKAAHKSYYNSSDSCDGCPSYYGNSDDGRDAQDDCYLTAGGGKRVASAGASATNCAAGTYRSGSKKVYYGYTLGCTKCAAGTYQPNAGQTSCSDCPGGTYQANTGQTSCNDCPKGQYGQGAGATSCKKCVAGTYNNETGALNSNWCKACDKGHSSNEGSDSCYLCPVGSYAPTIGQSSCTSCPSGYTTAEAGTVLQSSCRKHCNAGYYLGAQASYCSSCPEDRWCPGGTFYYSSQTQGLNWCPMGYESPAGSDDENDCEWTGFAGN